MRAFRTDGALGGVLQTEGSQGPPGVKAEGNGEGSIQGFAGIFVLAQAYRKAHLREGRPHPLEIPSNGWIF